MNDSCNDKKDSYIYIYIYGLIFAKQNGECIVDQNLMVDFSIEKVSSRLIISSRGEVYQCELFLKHKTR